MIRLIAFFPLEGAAFFEEGGKTFHTTAPYTPSVTEEVEEAGEFAQRTMGYLDGQGRTFADFAALKQFLGNFQLEEIRSNPALKRNRELLDEEKNDATDLNAEQLSSFFRVMMKLMATSQKSTISQVELSLSGLANVLEAESLPEKKTVALIKSTFKTLGDSLSTAYAKRHLTDSEAANMR